MKNIAYLCTMQNKIINLDTIDAYNKLYGLPTSHPLASVIDLKQAKSTVNHVRINYGVYALFLKNGVQCSIKYGRRQYDYQEGTVVSFSPGQVIDVEMPDEDVTLAPDVIGILFHPDLIYGTPLADKMSTFSFFDYSNMEALHLSEEEKAKFLDCLEKIKEEAEHPVDHHSATLLSVNIQVLLEYLHRFYDRQFITRHKVNSEIVTRFERELKSYYDTHRGGIPSVAYFASRLNLSAGYFGDLIKKETGSTAKDLITLHLITLAKQRLAAGNEDVSIIAYDLGFDYPAHFSRMFKRLTGQTPTQYRTSLSLS